MRLIKPILRVYSFVPTGKNDVHVRMLQMNSLLGLKAELIPIWLFAFFYGTVFAIGCINKKNGVIPFKWCYPFPYQLLLR